MSRRRKYDVPVPLFLIGAAITKGVKLRGGKLFRISVVRTHSHQYLIKYKCRAKDTETARNIDAAEHLALHPEQPPGPEGSGENHD